MREKDETKLDRIYTATLELTGKIGLAGLKMSRIAKEAGIASGTLYIYFESKEDLLNALFKKLQKEGAVSIQHQITDLPIQAQLYKMWSAALKALIENPMRMVFLEQFVVSPFISQENRALDQEFKQALIELLERGKQEKLIKDMDTLMMQALILGFVRNYSIQLLDRKVILEEGHIDHSFSLCWSAIAR